MIDLSILFEISGNWYLMSLLTTLQSDCKSDLSLLLRGGDLHFSPHQPVQMGQIYI